jgi:hypothetical protein
MHFLKYSFAVIPVLSSIISSLRFQPFFRKNQMSKMSLIGANHKKNKEQCPLLVPGGRTIQNPNKCPLKSWKEPAGVSEC